MKLKVGDKFRIDHPAIDVLASLKGAEFSWGDNETHAARRNIFRVIAPGKTIRPSLPTQAFRFPQEYTSWENLDTVFITKLPPGYGASEITPAKVAKVQRVIADWLAGVGKGGTP